MLSFIAWRSRKVCPHSLADRNRDNSILGLGVYPHLALIVIILSGMSGIACHSKSQLSDTEIAKRLEGVLGAAEGEGFSGAVLVDRKGKVVLNKGYGFANRKTSIPVTTETIFLIGSLTKQFTAAAILKLEATRKLRVEDPISKYLTGVPVDKQKVTVHHLLSHTSGFFSEFSDDDYDPAPRDEVVQRILASKLEFEPGRKYAYSNAGYLLLAAIVEKISAEPFEEFLERTLFEPAGLTHTGYVGQESAKGKWAMGYIDSAEWSPLNEPIVPGSWFRRGAGGIFSTAEDLYRWNQALNGESILSNSSKRKLFTPHVAESEDGRSFYGYGWVVGTTGRGTRVVWHNGSWYAFYAEMRRYLDEEVTVIFLTNTAGEVADRTRQKLLDALFAPL